MVVISIYWSITASINEVSLNYDVGRETAKFIKDNDLDEFNIFVAWRTIKDQETETQKYYYNRNIRNINVSIF